MQFNRFTSFTGVKPDERAVLRDIEGVASKGYVPVVCSDVKRSGPFRAAASWRQSAPESLQLAPDVDPSPPVTVDLTRNAEAPEGAEEG